MNESFPKKAGKSCLLIKFMDLPRWVTVECLGYLAMMM